jgi:hypothetical protein
LDVESLVNGFVRNTHGFVIREVGLQSVGNLFGRPTIDPFAVTRCGLFLPMNGACTGPETLRPLASRTLPSSRSCT